MAGRDVLVAKRGNGTARGGGTYGRTCHDDDDDDDDRSSCNALSSWIGENNDNLEKHHS